MVFMIFHSVLYRRIQPYEVLIWRDTYPHARNIGKYNVHYYKSDSV